MPCQLSVNINKFATLRNSRGSNHPNLLQIVNDLLIWGAHGITVHPRPDERHIKKSDVYEISSFLKNWNSQTKISQKKAHLVEFNIEGYPSEDFLQLIREVQPHQVTLVPDPPEALTSNAGWNCTKNFDLLDKVLHHLKPHTERISLFIDPFTMENADFLALKSLMPQRIELYTEAYAKSFENKKERVVIPDYKECAQQAYLLGIDVNAGHDLNQKNLNSLLNEIPFIKEVSIGHAFVCESLYQGMENCLNNYHKILEQIP